MGVSTNAEGARTPLTYGEKAVGLTFNPGGSEEVIAIKKAFAAAVDEIDTLRTACANQAAINFYNHAEINAINAQMLAVKAATWGQK